MPYPPQGVGTFPSPYSYDPTIVWSNPDERSTNSVTYVKLKETILTGFYHGMDTLRTYFELRTSYPVYSAYGRVYRNDSAVGAERSTTSTTYVSFTQDISGWMPNDKYQIYVRQANDNYIAYVRNQRILGVIHGRYVIMQNVV